MLLGLLLLGWYACVLFRALRVEFRAAADKIKIRVSRSEIVMDAKVETKSAREAIAVLKADLVAMNAEARKLDSTLKQIAKKRVARK